MSAREQGHDEPVPSMSEGRVGERVSAVAHSTGESARAASIAGIERRLAEGFCYCGGPHPNVAMVKVRWLIEQVRALEAQLATARAAQRYAGRVLEATRGENLGCDLDGGDAQDWATEAGLLAPVEVTAPCGDGCLCADYDNIPGECYRYTSAGQAAIDAARAGAAPRGGEGATNG